MKRLLLIAAVLLLLPPLAAGAETVSKIAAVVNEDIITTYQLDLEVAERLSAMASGQKIPAEQMQALRREALSKIIEETLIRQRTEELGLKVGDDEVEAAIEDVQRQNQLTREQLTEALEFQGLSFDKYRENLRAQILRFKLLGREVQAKVEVTNKELRDYFKEHIDDYRQEPYLHLSRITFPIPEKASTVQLEAIRNKAEEALVRLLQGEDFYAVLLAYTADQGADGGDMGNFAEGELTPAFERAVRELGEGEFSGLVETGEGFHILQLTERNAGNIRQFDMVKDEIEKKLREEKTEERFKAWSQKLRDDAYIDIRL